jgi:K+-sensing histidine kinase KdpD
MTSLRLGRWLLVAGLVGPLAAGAALIPLRDRIDNTNIALLLVVAVVAVAAAGRRPAAVTAAVSAAAAFNLFHTRPYLSLRIASTDDVVTAVLLLVVGIAVGELALRGRRARVMVVQSQHDLRSIQGLGRLVAVGEDPDYILLATSSELTHLLHLVDCRFEVRPGDDRILAVVERDGTVQWGPTRWEADRWGLPTDGVVIPVLAHGRPRGRFVLRAPVGLPYSQDQLARAVALVDQAGSALAFRAAA